jgi:hypothetical protein
MEMIRTDLTKGSRHREFNTQRRGEVILWNSDLGIKSRITEEEQEEEDKEVTFHSCKHTTCG